MSENWKRQDEAELDDASSAAKRAIREVEARLKADPLPDDGSVSPWRRDRLRSMPLVEARLRDEEPTPYPESHRSIESAMVMKQNNWLTQENARLLDEATRSLQLFRAVAVAFTGVLIWAAVVTAVLVSQ